MKKNTLKDIFKKPITPISIVLFGLMLLQEFERFLTGSKQLNKIKVMKKLSDYRIREFNGKFTVETKIETEEGFFRKRIKTRWVNIWTGGCQEGLTNRACVFDTLEEAKAKIVEWCDEPKYHYVVPDYSLKELPNFALGQKRYKVQSVPSMNVPVSEYLNCFKYKMFPPVILETKHKRISPADILYSAVRNEIITKSIESMKDVDELSELINENRKLKNDYLSLYKKHIGMIDAYKDLNRKVEELRAMLRAKKSNK